MADKGKKIVVEGDVFDRISHLPSVVLSRILNFLPIEELARTSLLSKNWRYIWTSHPNIKIDYTYLEIKKGRRECDILSKILLQHTGPVRKFAIFMDPIDDLDYSFIKNWLLYLSKNGIKELTLNIKTPCEFDTLPSHVFCPELVVLNLTDIMFEPPNGHAYFHKLTILNFSRINFESFKLASAINTPQLTHLTFQSCYEICHFKICAPKLKTFSVRMCSDVELNGFEMPEITSLALTELDSEKTELTELFERSPRISYLYVDGMTFLNLVPDPTHLERLPIMAVWLRHIGIEKMYLGDLHQISCMLYLLKNSNALSRLEIKVSHVWGRVVGNETIEVSKYLDAPHNMNWTTNSLEVVVIDGIYDIEIEMYIIKFLLSRSPKLKTMFVASRGKEKEIIKLSKRLMQYPRASTEAEIIVKRNVRVARIPEVYSLS